MRNHIDPEAAILISLDRHERQQEERETKVANALKRDALIAEARSTSLPIVLVDDGVEIRNAAAQLRTPMTPETVAQFELEKADHVKSDAPAWVKRLWNSLELKPGIGGFQIDLKKVFGWEEWK